MGQLGAAILDRFRGEDSFTVEADSETPLGLAGQLMDTPQTAETRDGRTIGYAEVGAADGDPLVLFHGFPNSRVFAALFDDVARDHGLRVVAPERPGLGVSDPHPDRTLTDWPADVADVADTLGIETFRVLGISGGGPYAVATAALLEDRVDRAGICCGLAPMSSVGIRERLWFYTARALPWGSKLALRVTGRGATTDRAAFLERIAESVSEPDRELWTGEMGQVIHASMIEARRNHGLDPLVTETAIYGRPWGVDLAGIDVPVCLWHGKADTVVPVEMGLYLTEAIPTAEAHIYPDLGHLSAIDATKDDMFAWLR